MKLCLSRVRIFSQWKIPNTEEAGVVQEERTELQNDISLKPKFRRLFQELWLQKEKASLLDPGFLAGWLTRK